MPMFGPLVALVGRQTAKSKDGPVEAACKNRHRQFVIDDEAVVLGAPHVRPSDCRRIATD